MNIQSKKREQAISYTVSADDQTLIIALKDKSQPEYLVLLADIPEGIKAKLLIHGLKTVPQQRTSASKSALEKFSGMKELIDGWIAGAPFSEDVAGGNAITIDLIVAITVLYGISAESAKASLAVKAKELDAADWKAFKSGVLAKYKERQSNATTEVVAL